MSVPPVTPSNGAHAITKPTRPERLDRAETSPAPAGSPLKINDAGEPVPHESDDAKPPGDQDGDKAAGVLRLLQAGHFKGVADVRLRINFFEQLSAQAATEAAAEAQTHAANLVDAVNAEVERMFMPLAEDEESPEVIGALRNDFDAAVQTAVEQFASDDGRSVQTLADALQSAFDTLVHGLRELLSTPAEPPPPSPNDNPDTLPGVVDLTHELIIGVNRAPAAVSAAEPELNADAAVPVPETGHGPSDIEPLDDTDDPNAALEAALTSLTATFDDLLSDLLDAANTALQLPDPSEPSGNGRAYDKFLAIYNELRGVAPGVDEVG